MAPGHRTLASLDCKQVPFFNIINSKLKTRGQCYITFTAVIYERAMYVIMFVPGRCFQPSDIRPGAYLRGALERVGSILTLKH